VRKVKLAKEQTHDLHSFIRQVMLPELEEVHTCVAGDEVERVTGCFLE
jgi:hypothetical protein